MLIAQTLHLVLPVTSRMCCRITNEISQKGFPKKIPGVFLQNKLHRWVFSGKIVDFSFNLSSLRQANQHQVKTSAFYHL